MKGKIMTLLGVALIVTILILHMLGEFNLFTAFLVFAVTVIIGFIILIIADD